MLGLDSLLELPGSGRAAPTVLAPRNNMAGSAAGNLPCGVGGDDDLKLLLDSLPDFEANRRLQKTLLAKHQARQKAEQARAAAVVRVQREAQEQAEEEAAAETAAAAMQQLREKLTLGVNLEELREHEAVLVALPPPQEPACIELDGGYLEAMQGAQAQLGLDLGLEAAAADEAEERVLQEMFLAGLRSGFVRSLALSRGEAGRPLVQALLATMTRSADAETAGAAFVTLMALMGCGAGGGGGGAGGSQGSGEADAEAEGEEAGDCLMLDAHYGLPGQVAAAAAAAGAGPGGGGGGSSVLPACRLACIPTDAELMEALRANGYQPGSGASASGGGDTSGGRGGRHQGSAAAAAQQQEEGGGSKEGQEGVVVRLQAIKLILRTAAAVCRYCAQHPGAPEAAGATSREGLAELLLACARMGLDPAANQLQQDLDAGTCGPPAPAEALLGAFDAADWERKLPQLAERLAEMGPSNAARLKLLKKVPTAHPRGLALQQSAAAVLLERLLPAAKLGGKSAARRRGGAAPDPAAVIAAQPWFGDAKGLVAGATSGGAQAPRGGYAIGVVELLLKVCHLLLWPHMLAYSQGEPSCVTADFLDAWLHFLVACQKHIRNMQPEDQAVKVLATYLELEYRNAAEAGMPLSP